MGDWEDESEVESDYGKILKVAGPRTLSSSSLHSILLPPRRAVAFQTHTHLLTKPALVSLPRVAVVCSRHRGADAGRCDVRAGARWAVQACGGDY